MANRALRVGGIDFNWKDKIGMFHGYIPVGRIHVDSYQRVASDKHVAEIGGEDFDPVVARDIALSYRDGIFWCYDSHHTLLAFIARGATEVRCTCVVGKSKVDENRFFYLLNDKNKKMAGWNKFASAISHGRVEQTLLLNETKKFNLSTPLDGDIATAKEADITSVGTLQEPYKKGKLRLLRRVLTVLSKSWRDADGCVKHGAKSIDFIRGLYNYLNRHSEDNINEIVDVLKGIEPDFIRQLANKKKSRGRIDAKQFTMAFESVLTVAGRIAA